MLETESTHRRTHTKRGVGLVGDEMEWFLQMEMQVPGFNSALFIFLTLFETYWPWKMIRMESRERKVSAMSGWKQAFPSGMRQTAMDYFMVVIRT